VDPTKAKHAFITGGASGIGLGVAEALADVGVPVTIADVDAESIDAAVARRPTMLVGERLDIRDRQAWALVKERAESKLGPVDILMNNAGIGPNRSELADMDAAAFDRIVAINLTGVFNGISAFAADMRSRRHGHIVNTSSMAGLYSGAPLLGGYSVAKAGVVAMSEALRAELAPHGVGVSVLCPGLVKTNLGRTTARLNEAPDPSAEMPESEVTIPAVANAVLSGIRNNTAYIVTHPRYWPQVEKRMSSLREAFS
jgi:NAD(P)-dependent dehydrogenase (short-subunit alcohol dehydrogenase family)